MPIHHATIKRAEKSGIELTNPEDSPIVRAFWSQRSKECFHVNDPKQALADMQTVKMATLEYPTVVLKQDDDFDWFWQVGENDTDDIEYPSAQDAFDAAIEYCRENGVDPEEGYEDEKGRVIVPDTYKQRYAERGDRNTCGDWLAQTLKDQFVVLEDGKPRFDEPKYTEMLKANGVEIKGKWSELPASGQKGWEGRYRMNGRQKLEIRVLINDGVLTMHGKKYEAPDSWLSEMYEKHPEHFPEE